MASTFENTAEIQTNPDGRQQKQLNEAYKFSPDELRVLKQCNVESFYQRSLPFSSVLGVGTYYAIKAGYIKGHSRFGAGPKITIAVIAGYFLGKLSYQQKCAEKIMALPDSKLGELLRQRKRQGISENISLDAGFSAPLGADSATVDSAPKQSYLDIDSDRPYVSDYDKHSHDDITFDVSAIPVPPGGPPVTSYDELRRRNREEYDTQKRGPVRTTPEPSQAPIASRPPLQEPATGQRKAKNKYGDDWEL